MAAKRTKRNQDEHRFLEQYDADAFERLSVSVDVSLLTQVGGELRVFLVRRDEHPFRGQWSLPGGFVGVDESLEAAARRVLRDKAALEGVFLEQLFTFGQPDRDPRTRVLTVAYYALVDWSRLAELPTGSDAALATLHVPFAGETGGPVDVTVDGEPLLVAFDHADIVGMAIKRLRGKLDYAPIGFQLLPERFTLLQLQQLHETVLGQQLNKDSFRRRMLQSGMLEATGEREKAVGHRPAELYRFVHRSAI